MAAEATPRGLVTSTFAKITMADETKEYVERCRRALSKHTGPIAGFFIKEVIVSLTANGRFSHSQVPRLVEELEKKIDIDADRAEFRKAVS